MFYWILGSRFFRLRKDLKRQIQQWWSGIISWAIISWTIISILRIQSADITTNKSGKILPKTLKNMMIDLLDGIFSPNIFSLIQKAGHQSISSRDVDDQRILPFD